MRKKVQRLGMLCLLLCYGFLAKAQGDVTALWDFQNKIPETLKTVFFNGTAGDVASDVDGVSMHVDATNGGKFDSQNRASDVQINPGTKLQVPVKSTKDVVTVTSYPGYHDFTVGGVAAEADLTEHRATTAEVAQGYAEIVAVSQVYLYSVKVTFVSAIQEKELYSTNFTEWGAYENADTYKTDPEVQATWNTKYSHEQLTFSIYDTQIGATNFNTGKFPNHTGGMLMADKSDKSYVVTSALASVTKVHFVHGATGSKRGWKLWAKGDGDADWVVISDEVASTQQGTEVTKDVNRTNCQLKFTNLTTNQNAYLMQLDIYGSVDMSKTPALGTFKVNGTQYQAADIFDEDAEGNMSATIEISKAEPKVSADNPLTDVVAENGDIKSITYTDIDNGTLASIVVTANGIDVTYNASVVFKPDFTLTYYNTDGTKFADTQIVEKDSKIATLRSGDDVAVADGKAFRGWFAQADGGEKYTADYVVTSDLNLYAVATDIETESTTKRYTYDLADKYFYDEDHEAFNATGGSFHDGTHGWSFASDGKVELLVGGHAYINLGLCQYSSGDITLTDAQGQTVGTVAAKATKDGAMTSIEYNGAAGKLTLSFSGTTYLHRVIIANVQDSPIEKNAQGWYVVKQGDAGNLLTTLEVANSAATSDARTYIFVPDGTYDLGNTVLTPISGNNISVIGQSMDKTIIVNTPKEEGIAVTATFLITGQNTYLQDLTLKNAYDYYKPGLAGRAVVIQDKGSRTICKNVKMLSYQDTYYSNNNSQYYFETSDIHGTVDFICGSGDVFFNKCKLVVEPRTADGSGECTITAPNTDQSCRFGYVFDGCVIDSKAEKFNYGRAWNNTPRCVYLNTTLLQPDKLVSTRWTLDGMNVVADKFAEYKTLNAEGTVISPESLELTFKYNTKENKMQTILTDEQAAGYTLDKVFTDWTPAVYATQAVVSKVTAEGNTLTWPAVDGASAYAVFNGDSFVGMTSETSFTFADGEAKDYVVRAANAHGGFGIGTTVDGQTGVENTVAGSDTVATYYYNAQGMRVNSAAKGLVIKVNVAKDGKKTVLKVNK